MTEKLKTLTIFLKSYQHVALMIQQSLEGSELTANEFTALEALCHKGPMTTKQLCATVLLPNSSMTYVVDQLEKKEYVTRKKDDIDKRIIHVLPTKQGEVVLNQAYQQHYQVMSEVFAVLTPSEQEQIQQLLKKLGKHAQQLKEKNDEILNQS